MRTIAIALVTTLLAGSSAASASQPETASWREVAQTIPLGSKVKVHTLKGQRMSGTLMSVAGDGVLLKKNTRRSEPAVSVPFTDIDRLERDQGNGLSIGKAVAVGLATGAGFMATLILFALQFD